MDPAQLQSLSARLDAVLELAPAEREAALAAYPPDEAAQLRRLLADATPLDGPPPLAEASWAGEVGELVGPYRLLAPLGRGGMGEVWRAERADGTFEREVALKLPRLRPGQDLEARLRYECRVVARLEHPHIARLYEAGSDRKGRPWIASEFIAGRPLDQAILDLEAMDRLRLLLRVVRAVAYAHGRGVLHRDLKPANVLVDATGAPHVLDLGVAGLAGDDEGGQALPRALTPGYAAPEQLAGEPDDVRSDVYALGVIGQEVLRDLSALDAHRRADLGAVLAHATKPNPADRYESAGALADELERCLRGDVVDARPLGSMARALRAVRRRWQASVSVALLGSCLLVAGGVSFIQHQRAAKAQERERVAQEFVKDLFGPVAAASGVTSGASLIDQGVRLIESRFAQQPELQQQLYGRMAASYRDMGDVMQALSLRKRQWETLPAETPALGKQAVLLALAVAEMDAGQPQQGLKRLEAAPQPHSLDARLQMLRGRVLLGRFDEAQPEIDALDRELPAEGEARARWLGLKAESLQRRGRIDDSVAGYAQAAEMADRAEALALAAELRAQGAHWAAQSGLKDKAMAMHLPSQQTYKRLGGPFLVRALLDESKFWTQLRVQPSVSYAEAMGHLTSVLTQLQLLGPAVPNRLRLRVEEDLLSRRMTWGETSPDMLDRYRAVNELLLEGEQRPLIRMGRYLAMGLAETQLGRYEAAEEHLLLSLEERRAGGQGHHPFVVIPYRALAINAMLAGSRERALAHLDAAPTDADLTAAGHKPEWYRSVLTKQRARVLLHFGDPAGALKLLEGLQPHRFDQQAGRMSIGLNWLRGEALCAQRGREAAGLALLKAEWQALSPDHHPQHPDVQHARNATEACEQRLRPTSRPVR